MPPPRIKVFLAPILIYVVSILSLPQTTRATDLRHVVVWPGANVTYPNSTPEEITDLAQKLADTHVGTAILDVRWAWSEPTYPLAYPTGPHSYYGPRMQAYHNYDFTALDQVITELSAREINIVIKIHRHPVWAGGNSCDWDDIPCGIIYYWYRQTLKDALYDLCYNMASRYPAVTSWIMWNEPNLDKYFSPQLWQGEYLQNVYMDLIVWQMRHAIKDRIPNATIIGPDLFTPDWGEDKLQQDKNWWYTHKWLTNWADTLLRYFSTDFDIFTIHNYTIIPYGHYMAAARLWNKMNQLGKVKPIWLSEFNFGNATCDQTEGLIADKTYYLYDYYMFWERSAYYALHDGCVSESCGGGLLKSRFYGYVIKPILYPSFVAIVDGTYNVP